MFELRFSSQVSAPMPRFLIDYHCNGHTAQCEGVELGSVEQAGAHALAAAPQMFNDLMSGERRECALSVRDGSLGGLSDLRSLRDRERDHDRPGCHAAPALWNAAASREYRAWFAAKRAETALHASCANSGPL